mgnify:CR=1 FL=1
MTRKDKRIIENQKHKQDFYLEGKIVVMTEDYHIKRGSCCGNGCKHCPYMPKHTSGSRETKQKNDI